MTEVTDGRVVRIEATLEAHDKKFEIVDLAINDVKAGIPQKWKVDLMWKAFMYLLTAVAGGVTTALGLLASGVLS